MNDNWHKIFHDGERPSEEQLLRYVNDELSPEERNAVERYLLDCDVDADMVEGLELLKQRDPGYPQRLALLQHQIEGKVTAENSGNRKWIYWSAAASVAVLIGIGLTWFLNPTNTLDRPQLAQKQVEQKEQKVVPKETSESEDLALKKEIAKEEVSDSSNYGYRYDLSNWDDTDTNTVALRGLSSKQYRVEVEDKALFSLAPSPIGDANLPAGSSYQNDFDSDSNVTAFTDAITLSDGSGTEYSYQWSTASSIDNGLANEEQKRLYNDNNQVIDSLNEGADWVAGTPQEGSISLDQKPPPATYYNVMPNPALNGTYPASDKDIVLDSTATYQQLFSGQEVPSGFYDSASDLAYNEVATKEKQEELAVPSAPEEEEMARDDEVVIAEKAEAERYSIGETTPTSTVAEAPAKAEVADEVTTTTTRSNENSLDFAYPSPAIALEETKSTTIGATAPQPKQLWKKATQLAKEKQHQSVLDYCDALLKQPDASYHDRAKLQKAKSLMALDRKAEAKPLLEELSKSNGPQ